MKKVIVALTAISIMLLTLAPTSFAQTGADTVPLDAFAALPVIRNVSVSPDGKKLAIVRASSNNGDYIIEITNLDNLKEKPVRLGANKMLVSGISWLNEDKILVQFRQILRDGSKSYWVNKIAITDADGKGKWLVPFRKKKNLNFSLVSLLPDEKDYVLIEADVNNNRTPDVVRMNINSGRTTTILRGNSKIQGDFVADKDGEIRAASGWNTSDDTIDLFARKKGDDEWITIYQNSPKKRENFSFLGFSDEKPNQVYVNANLGEDKTGIYLYDLETGTYSERLFGLKGVDAGGIVTNKWGKLLGYSYTTKQPKTFYVDENEQALYDSITPLFAGKFVRIASRSDDDNMLVIFTQSGQDPGTYYLLRDKQKLEKIGERNPRLTAENLSPVKYVTYKTRDGRKTKAYVTIPKGNPPFSAVVLPHGGPWARDVNIYDEWTQVLAHHGYIVIQPQYRGSEGYGLEHWKAGDKLWGLAMQDDMDDAAMYLVDKGLAKKDKLALFGWSYGGYAGFVASMRENNIYQCSIAGAGVSDLNRINATLNESIFLKELQKPTIDGLNPIKHVDKVNIPILVVHGDIDIRVPVKHSREFVDLLEKYNKDYKYVELNDADHFSDTLFYDHKTEFYSAMLDWLENKCQL
ncbi:S9 family peptidase [Thalassotalea sp. M1531]|uniref:S9 family peptidase n=1 Tax=Thalassotalea algicola TaxID=2716224 RepID=A0A7Y0LD27_9GAMM|nr:prolyl oligopeptidase family serine peptidase [Thalassotalea algicola]NMP32077.1 S9 family peptidase [Thalassotalea algicola]